MGEEERKSKKEETTKEPVKEKDQSLESDLEGEGGMGEIMESKEKRSSTPECLIFLRRWRFQLERRKKFETKANLFRYGEKIRGKES